MRRAVLLALLLLGWGVATGSVVQTSAEQSEQKTAAAATPQATLEKYCVTCHNQKLKTAGLALDTLDATQPHVSAETWELVIGKLRARSMPPAGRPRPDAATYRAVATALEGGIDRAWAAHPNPGRIAAVHRLNRTEYTNAVRDLLAIDFDARPLLPGDETADGSFDNLADALSISTAHLERYLSVARQVSRLAMGLPPASPRLDTFEIPIHVIQEDRQSEQLPFGSRGGMAIPYTFAVDGEYLIKVKLQRQYQDYLKGMGWPQQLDVRVDGKLIKRFTVGGNATGRPAALSYAGDGEPGFAGDPDWEKYMQLTGDAGLEVRVPVEAGPHVVGVSFVRELWEPEGLPHPPQRGRTIANDNDYMGYANVGSVQIGGPYEKVRLPPSPSALRRPGKPDTTPTPSRSAILICHPQSRAEETACARKILSRIARRAYRRPATSAETKTLLEFFSRGRRTGGSFEAGIQLALERVLIDPGFLLRVYRNEGTSATQTYRLSDFEVASRLSFFLWSSIPDDRLLDLAARKQLTTPATLEQEVRRMLADPRAATALVDGFAAQWLNLRRLADVVVDPDRYPTYDDSLLQAFEQETELFVANTLREDRSVTDLLDADYTFVNERLARHYGIPGVYGSRFRKVLLPNHEQRGGLLAHGSLLATTSYPDRTSPVLRGKFLLNNILGLPTPPPPPGVDTNLAEIKPDAPPPTIRERLAQHRTSPSCASCHSVIDPLGFALEQFDAIGAWRTTDESGKPVDARATTLDGATIEGMSGLRTRLLEEPEQFPRTVTEKLLAYALGRRLEYYDRPAVRMIVRDAAASQYRWSSLILGIVKSPAFLMRDASGPVPKDRPYEGEPR
jgi:mono/diheme cytochrome c family protein